jgi:hypothetical protein
MKQQQNWVFPIAGKGLRTQALGEFKPFIEIEGKAEIEWLLFSVGRHIGKGDPLIFITSDTYEEKFAVRENIGRILENLRLSNPYHLLTTRGTLQGPSATVFAARDLTNVDCPCIVINSDQFISFEFPAIEKNCAYLPVNTDFGEKKSYVAVEEGIITDVVEKENISCIASAGVYIVASGIHLNNALEQQFREGAQVKGEYYVGPALRFLLDIGYRMIPIPVMSKFDLGSIEGISLFGHFVKGFKRFAVSEGPGPLP